MKVYSIFVHPNKQSLNGTLFNMANKHFVQKGYEVDTLDLFGVYGDLHKSVDVLYQSSVPLPIRKYESSFHYNYIRAKEEEFSDFSITELGKLKNADILYIQTPIMVWMLPAILKLYIESTFLPNGAFVTDRMWADDFVIDKQLAGKKVFFSIVTGAGVAYCNAIMGSVDNMINPIKSVFEFVGYEWMEPHITWGTTESVGPRKDYLSNFQDHLDKII